MSDAIPNGADAGNPNSPQIAFWNSPTTRAWVTLQARMDELFAGLTEVALDHAAPRPGETVLDIGCGCGDTVLRLAERVGPAGHVLGVDVSEPMLARAQQRVTEAGYGQARLRLADVSAANLGTGVFDLAFSRFGVMFFFNPVEAFTNLRHALKPSGRLVFACFRPMAENTWVTVPQAAGLGLFPPAPPPGPEDPGQFAFGDPARVRRILEGAGFRDLTFTPHNPAMRLGDTAAQAAAISTQIGAYARALAEAPEQLPALMAALTAAYAAHEGPEGVVLPGAIWLVSARA
ncbi:MAG TPA: methyltransferase domain-containing protein [Acetobacteraceae bacterium]